MGPAAGAMGSSSATQLQLAWQELDADLPYNKSRATAMHQGQLRCYQLGSATLGRSINEDDAEKGVQPSRQGLRRWSSPGGGTLPLHVCAQSSSTP